MPSRATNASTLVTDRLNLLRDLASVDESSRNSLIDGALDKRALLAITETAYNVILGVLPANERQLTELEAHRQDLLELTLRKTSQRRRREILQSSGLYRTILDIALPQL